MGEELEDGRIGRRDLLKKGAVAGGLVWASPMVFSGTAGADHPIDVGACNDCPHHQLYGVKYNNGTGFESLPTASNPGNCLTSSAPFPPDCFQEQNLFTIAVSDGGDTHTWILAEGVEFCMAAGKVGGGTVEEGEDDCFSCGGSVPCDGGTTDPEPRINVTPLSGNRTQIVVSDPALSHSEIIFCYRGSPISC